jgi:chromosome partitioning protein
LTHKPKRLLFKPHFTIKVILKKGRNDMIITVGNTKGGVGKTTLAVNIAAARAQQGRDVLLIDGDRQGTAQIAVGIRANDDSLPGIACVSYPEGPILRTQVLQQKMKYDDIIIDAGGRDSTALRAALVLSDALLVPYRPGSFDVWALEDISALIKEARSVRDGLNVFAIINAADSNPHSIDNREAAEVIADFPELTLIPKHIVARKAWSNGAASGKCTLEMKPRDPKADADLERLISILFS